MTNILKRAYNLLDGDASYWWKTDKGRAIHQQREEDLRRLGDVSVGIGAVALAASIWAVSCAPKPANSAEQPSTTATQPER